MPQSNLNERISTLERRLADIEAHLGIAVKPPLQEQISWGEIVPERSILTSPPPLPVQAMEETTAEIHPWHQQPPLPVEVIAYEPSVARAPAVQSNLEQAIGLKWAGRIGALILAIGAGLGINFAYEQGWFGGLPDSAKLVLMSLAGFALIGAGEWVFRRVNKVSAVGLYAAGVAVFFLVSYAGFGFYGLYARNTAFVLMGLSTLIGAAVAKRGNLVSIAVLSLIGGNLAPIVLRGPAPDLHAFLVYLLMLQIVALVLAAWGGDRKWWTLRGLSLAINAGWISALLLDPSQQYETAAKLTFLLFSTVLYQAELILSASRTQPSIEPESIQKNFDGHDLALPGVLFSMLVTACLTAAILIVLQLSTDAVRGTWVLGIAATCAALGYFLPRRGDTSLRAMGIGYRVQAATLLVVAVPVCLTGFGIEIGWIALAVAFAVLAWALDLRIARTAAVITWGLAVGHWFLRWQLRENDGVPSVRLSGVSSDLLIAALLALAGHGISLLVDRSRSGFVSGDRLRWIPTIGATLVWMGASVALLSPLAATLSLVVYAWVLLAGDTWTDRLGAAVQAVVVLGMATVKWVFVDLLADRLSVHWSPTEHAAVFNPAMGIGVLIAVSLVALFWWRREVLLSTLREWGLAGTDEREVTLFLAALVIGLLSIGISFEIERGIERAAQLWRVKTWPASQLKQLAFTMLWAVAACAQLLLARYVEPSSEGRRLWLGRIGWIPMALAVKFLLVDSLAFRIGSGVSPALVFFNLQTLAAIVVLGALATICFIAAECDVKTPRRIAGFLIVLILLCTGSIEIDRLFEKRAGSGAMSRTSAMFAKQVATSIFGAVFAIMSVTAGFYFRSAPVRYLGLSVFAITLLKVVFVDLAGAGQGYRVLSFLGLGLLLLGTSVLYGKLSPKLLQE